MDDASFQGVPEIVRLNFKALHDVVKAHGEALKSVEKAVANKVGRPEHTAAMQEKVSVAELTTTFEELSRVIDNKADARDTSAIVERMTSRAELQAALADKADVSEVQRCLDAKAGASDTQQLLTALEARISDAQSTLGDELAAKASSSSLEHQIELRCTKSEVKTIVAEAIDGLKTELRAEFSAALEAKASKASVAAALKAKANRQDVEELLQGHAERLHSSLSAKADVDAVSSALSSKASRAEVTEAVEARVDEARHALERAISEKTGHTQFSGLQEELDKRLAVLKSEVAKAEEAAHAASTRIDRELQSHAKEMMAALQGKASTAELSLRARTSEVESMLGMKPDRSEIEIAAQAVAQKLSSEIGRASQELRAVVDDRAAVTRNEMVQLSAKLGQYIERSEVESLIKNKCDTREVELWLQSKAGLNEVTQQIESLGNDLSRQVEPKATSQAVTAAMERQDVRIATELDNLRLELQQAIAPMANAAQVEQAMQSLTSRTAVDTAMASLEKKANIDDINRSLTEVNRELAQRPTLAELNRVIGEQSLIMESLCSEHLLGRWIWKSGRVKGEKHAVPWNVQVHTTHAVAHTHTYASSHPLTPHTPSLPTPLAEHQHQPGELRLGEGPMRDHDRRPRPVRGHLRLLHAEEALRPAAGQWRAGTLCGQLGVVCGASLVGPACGGRAAPGG